MNDFEVIEAFNEVDARLTDLEEKMDYVLSNYERLNKPPGGSTWLPTFFSAPFQNSKFYPICVKGWGPVVKKKYSLDRGGAL